MVSATGDGVPAGEGDGFWVEDGVGVIVGAGVVPGGDDGCGVGLAGDSATKSQLFIFVSTSAPLVLRTLRGGVPAGGTRAGSPSPPAVRLALSHATASRISAGVPTRRICKDSTAACNAIAPGMPSCGAERTKCIREQDRLFWRKRLCRIDANQSSRGEPTRTDIHQLDALQGHGDAAACLDSNVFVCCGCTARENLSQQQCRPPHHRPGEGTSIESQRG